MARDPGNVKARINMGVLSLEDEQADTAISLLSSAYRYDSKNFEIDNNLGNAYRMKGDYENAIKYYLEALSLQGTNSTVRLNLARCYASSSQPESARSTYEDVVKSNNKNWDAFLELAKVCIQLKDNSAEKYLVYLQKNNPGFHAAEVKNLLDSMSSSGLSK